MCNIPFSAATTAKLYKWINMVVWIIYRDSAAHSCRIKGWIIWQVRGKHDSNENLHATSYFQGETGQCCSSSFFFIHHLSTLWINTSEVCRRGDEKRGEINTWLGTSNLPPSKAGRRVPLQWSFWSVRENATAGLNRQIKGSSAPFSFCFDKKIADYSQFICLCPLLVPGAVKRWLKSSRWWDRIAPRRWTFVWNWWRRRRQPLHRAFPACTALVQKKFKTVLAWKSLSSCMKTSEQSIVPLKTSALQAQQVQISPRTIKEKNTQTHSTHFKAVSGI